MESNKFFKKNYSDENLINKFHNRTKSNNSNVLPRIVDPDTDYVTKLNLYNPAEIKSRDILKSSNRRSRDSIIEHLRSLGTMKVDESPRKKRTTNYLVESKAEEELKELKIKHDKINHDLKNLYSRLEHFKKQKLDLSIDLELLENNIKSTKNIIVPEIKIPLPNSVRRQSIRHQTNLNFQRRKTSIMSPEQYQEIARAAAIAEVITY